MSLANRTTVLTLAAFTAATPAAHAASWIGNYEFWNAASRWTNPANVPDTASEVAIIGNGGVCYVNANYAIGGLVLTNGMVSIGAGFGVSTPVFAWTGGSLAGSGATNVTGDATIAIDSNSAAQLFTGTLNLQGNTDLYNVRDNGFGVYLQTGAVLNNAGTLSISDDTSIYGDGNNVVTVNNTGTIRKTAGTGLSQITYLNNNGTVSAQSGTLTVSAMAGGGSSYGAFTATAGRTLNLSTPTTHLLRGMGFSGAGAINLTGGTFTTDATTVTGGVTSTATDFNLAGATLVGTYGLTHLDWSAGTIGTTATTYLSVSAATRITGTNSTYRTVNAATLTLQGTTELSGNTGFGLLATNNSTVNNLGTLQLTTNAGLYVGPGTNTYNNSGTIVKTAGTGTSSVYGLVNTGTVSAQSGTLQAYLRNASTGTGTFATATNAAMSLITDGTTHTFGPGVTVTGTGTFRFPQDVFNINGTVEALGLTFDVSDVTASTAVDVSINGPVQNSGASLVYSFTKAGPGTLRMGGTNVYAGGTRLLGGTLIAAKSAYQNVLTNNGGLIFSATDAKFVCQYLTPADNPVAQVKAILAAGYPIGFGSGQIRSTVTPGNPDLAIGYADNGIALTIAVTIAGDSNLDGVVNFNDFLALQSAFGQSGARWDQGNFNYDNVTNFNDFLILQSHFGQALPGLDAAVTAEQVAALSAFGSTSAVPEPGTLATLSLAAVGLKRRRR